MTTLHTFGLGVLIIAIGFVIDWRIARRDRKIDERMGSLELDVWSRDDRQATNLDYLEGYAEAYDIYAVCPRQTTKH